jgi:plastocyanin
MRHAVFALSLLLLACPSAETNTPVPSKASTTTQNPQAVPGNTATMNPVTPTAKESPGNRVAPAPQTVIVDLTEYAIHMPDALAAGRQMFQVTNRGEETHGLVIAGDGFHQQVVTDLQRGDSVTVEVTLAPGSYSVWCPEDNHKGKGMMRQLTVHQ